MKSFEKAISLAHEIRTLANQSGYGNDRSQKPCAISVEKDKFPPTTPKEVLAELNRPRRKMKGASLWTMVDVVTNGVQKNFMLSLMEQTNERSDVLYFPPHPRKKL